MTESDNLKRKAQGDGGLASVISAASNFSGGDGAEVANEAFLTERHKATCETWQQILSSPIAKDVKELLDSQIKNFVDRKAQAQEKITADAFRQAKWAFAMFVGLMLAAFVFLACVIHMLKDQKDLLLPVITAIISLITGATGVFIAGRQLPFRSK